MQNTILLHTTTIVEEVHLVHLPLILRLQLLLLSGKSGPLFPLGQQACLQLIYIFFLGRETGPELIHLLLQLRVILLRPLYLASRASISSFS